MSVAIVKYAYEQDMLKRSEHELLLLAKHFRYDKQSLTS